MLEKMDLPLLHQTTTGLDWLDSPELFRLYGGEISAHIGGSYLSNFHYFTIDINRRGCIRVDEFVIDFGDQHRYHSTTTFTQLLHLK